MRNHLGSYECKLCLTLHTNEGIVQGLYGNCGDITCCRLLPGSYLAHTQGKKHQINLARRAAREKQADQAACS